MKAFLKKYMVAGLLVLVPVVATVWLLKTLIIWLNDLPFTFLPHQLRPEYLLGYDIPGVGLLLTFVVILLAGIFTRLYIGKKIVKLGDAFFGRLPFGRAIYQAIKQVTHSTLSEAGQKTRRVVLVEYPKAGIYAIGFLTGSWGDHCGKSDLKDRVMVFVPTAPNPTSGFLLIVARNDVIPLEMSAEEASRLLISGGLLAKEPEVA